MPARPTSPPLHRTLVCLGQISGAHGVRGLVKLQSFTEQPEGVGAYGPLTDATGTRRFDVTLLSSHKGQWLAKIDGVADRNAAEALAGTRLHVARDRLPPPEDDEFYHADLIGLRAEDPTGAPLGRVLAVHDFGAGDVLELVHTDEGGSRATQLVPFTRSSVPEVDLAGGRLVVVPLVESDDDVAEPGEDTTRTWDCEQGAADAAEGRPG